MDGGGEAGGGSAVPDVFVIVQWIKEPAKAVVLDFSVVQLHRSPPELPAGGIQEFVSIQSCIPLADVLHCGDDGTGGKDVRNIIVAVDVFALDEFVTGGAMRENDSGIATGGGGHLQRGEDAFLDEVPIFFATRIFHDEAEQVVASVAIGEGVSRLEGERDGAHFLDELLLGEVFGELKPVHDCIVFDAGGVSEQMANGNIRPGGGSVFEMLRNFVVHRKLPILREQQNAGGGELFGHGTDFKDCILGGGDIPFQVGETVAFGLQFLSILQDSHGESGNVVILHFRFDQVIDLVGKGGGRERQAK